MKNTRFWAAGPQLNRPAQGRTDKAGRFTPYRPAARRPAAALELIDVIRPAARPRPVSPMTAAAGLLDVMIPAARRHLAGLLAAVMLLPLPLLAQSSLRLSREGFVAAGGRSQSAHLIAVQAAGVPALSGMESSSFSIGPVTAVELAAAVLPQDFALLPNYPNPFNQTTTLAWQLPRRAEVRIVLYSLLGREVVLLYRGWQAAGQYRLVYAGVDAQGQPLPSGLYFVQFTAADVRRVGKMTIVR